MWYTKPAPLFSKKDIIGWEDCICLFPLSILSVGWDHLRVSWVATSFAHPENCPFEAHLRCVWFSVSPCHHVISSNSIHMNQLFWMCPDISGVSPCHYKQWRKKLVLFPLGFREWQVVPDDEDVIFASMRLAACFWVGMTGIAWSSIVILNYKFIRTPVHILIINILYIYVYYCVYVPSCTHRHVYNIICFFKP